MSNIQKGGKLIGQGSYGCVFRPMIPCEGKTIREKGKVSKVLHMTEAYKELEETKKIDKIDPKGIYHFVAPEMCKINKKYYNEPGLK
jgi:hypothetical protein